MHCAVWTWLCGRGQLSTRSCPGSWPRLRRTATAPGRRQWLRTVGIATPDSHGARIDSNRSVENRTTAHGACACTARCGLGCVAGANSRRASAQFVGRGSAARPPHLVGGCGFGPSVLQRTTLVTYGLRFHRPVEARTTAHRACECTAQYGLGCVAGANLRPAPAQVLDRGSAARPPHQVGGSGFVPSALPRPTPMARASCSNRSVENRTTAHGACACTARCGLGCMAGANSRRAPA